MALYQGAAASVEAEGLKKAVRLYDVSGRGKGEVRAGKKKKKHNCHGQQPPEERVGQECPYNQVVLAHAQLQDPEHKQHKDALKKAEAEEHRHYAVWDEQREPYEVGEVQHLSRDEEVHARVAP